MMSLQFILPTNAPKCDGESGAFVTRPDWRCGCDGRSGKSGVREREELDVTANQWHAKPDKSPRRGWWRLGEDGGGLGEDGGVSARRVSVN